MKNQINLLIYMLDDVRKVTLKGVNGLTKEQLFKEPIPGEFPIGSYLMHNGEVDVFWLSVLSGEQMPEDLKRRVHYGAWYDPSPDKSNPPKEPIEPEEYINAMSEARQQVMNYVLSLNDENLEDIVTLKRTNGNEEQLTKKWIIYHLIEHEAHHRGQMFMLIRKAGFKKKGENN